jgi:predicted membrane channel-forming protein YqfA (hemolysin III family)
MMYFGGNLYSMGTLFYLSKHEDKIRFRLEDDLYLSIMMDPIVAEHLDESCK